MRKTTQTEFQSAATDGINVHVRRTKTFKSVSVQVWFGRELDENATSAALLAAVLGRGCKKFPDTRAMAEELEKMYGAGFRCGVSRVGGRQVLAAKMEIPDPAFLPRKPDLTNRCFAFLRNVLLRPRATGGAFDTRIFERERTNLAAQILSLTNDKMAYAQRRLFEETCRGERLRFYEHGDVAALAALTPESLYGFYRDFARTAPMDVFVVGDISLSRAVALVRRHLRFEREAGPGFAPIEKVAAPARPRRVTEEQKIKQAKLCVALRTGTRIGERRFAAATVFNGVLGGFSHSRLFRHVREKAGLAYQADSFLEGSHGLIAASMGIEAKNYERAMRILRAQLRELAAGRIGADEIAKTKQRIASRLEGTADNPSQMISFHYAQAVNGGAADLEHWIGRVKAVRADDVRAVAEKTKIDTIFLLRPEK